jgi:hypothetical protein
MAQRLGSTVGRVTRVLFISGAQGADFQCDMLLHGLRSTLGPDCVDLNRFDSMYEGSPRIGFWSVYGNPPDVPIDRTDIPAKIAARYFDAVVYGSIHRCNQHLDAVRAAYPPSRIAFIDGEDDYGHASLRGAGLYFKREIPDDPAYDWMLPIQFCIPQSKVRDFHEICATKTRLMSPLDPRDRSTYQYYESESGYYDQYSQSYFGLTMKKGGWDCSRHYEILASGCMPYFLDLENCPRRTMNWLPKLALIRARRFGEEWMDLLHGEWCDLMFQVRRELFAHMTTEAMAEYVLGELAK